MSRQPETLLLACPRVSPEWELAAQLALIKPKPSTRGAIAHNRPQQPWPRGTRGAIEEFLQSLPAELRQDLLIAFPRGGEHRFVIHIQQLDLARARRLARRLSRRLPRLWFALDEGYVRDGVFYQRTGKYKLELVRTKHVRLRRSVRLGFLGEIDAVTSNRQNPGQDQPAQPDR